MNPAILFFIVVAVITVIALWIVLRPLLVVRDSNAGAATNTNVDAIRIELSEARRDQKLGLLSESGLVEAERELESRVLAEAEVEPGRRAPRSKGTAIALGIILPVLAIAGYAAVGSPVAVVPDVVRPPQQAADNADQQMSELFRMAEERLKAQPDDAMGWALLARAKASVGQFDGAIAAYEKAVALTPNDGDLWADYADAAAGQSQGKMEGKPIALINKAIALDGKNPKALLLRGTYEIQKNDLAAAEKSFMLAKSVVEPASGFAQIADNALADIQSRRGGGATTGAPAATAKGDTSPASGEAASASDAVLASVQLQLASDARKAAGTSSAVFLIVRAVGVDRGPPLAAKKIALADVDKPVMLTAADAMIGGAGLKAGTDVTLQARLSVNGQPTPQTGDWQSGKAAAKLPTGALRLAIDQPVQN
jgi:cytochrome c-type biogenesis protein CcmH